jgi:hypothetical protein
MRIGLKIGSLIVIINLRLGISEEELMKHKTKEV